MTGKKKKMIRSHRSLRAYKPTNKAILNREASKRRQISRTVRGAMAAGLQEGPLKIIVVAAVAFLGGSLFGWICCAVLSANITAKEWEIMMDELEKGRYGTIHQEESEW